MLVTFVLFCFSSWNFQCLSVIRQSNWQWHFIIIIATRGCSLQKYQKYFFLVKPLLDCFNCGNDVIIKTCQMVVFSIIRLDVDYMILLNTYLAIFTIFSCSYCDNYSNTICLLQRYDKNSNKNRPETLFHNIVIYCYDHEKTYGSNTYTLQDMFKLAKTHHKGASEMNITIYELNINSIWNTS